MTHTFPRGAGVLLGLGIFFIVQCSSTGRQQERYGVTVQGSSPGQVLQWVDQSLGDDPNQPTLWLVRAEALHGIALEETAIGERIAHYREMHRSVLEVEKRALPFAQEQALARLLTWKDSLVTTAWSSEFAQAMELITFDESETLEVSFATIIAHLQNAMTVRPDTLVTYERMSMVFYRHGDLPAAVEALELGMQQTSIPPDTYLEKLAFLYLETGNLDASITVYREILSRGMSDEGVATDDAGVVGGAGVEGQRAAGQRAATPERGTPGAARQNIRKAYLNALILSGDHDQAVRELESFLAELENRAADAARGANANQAAGRGQAAARSGTLDVRAALLSERLFKLETDAYPLLQMVMGGGMATDRLDDLSLQFARIEQLLSGLLTERAFTNDTEALYSIAVQYIRVAKVLQDAATLFSELSDADLVSRCNSLRRQVLVRSIPIWSRLHEGNPENREILETLIGLHEALGERARADELRRRLER